MSNETLRECPYCGHEGNTVSGEPGFYEILCDGCDHACFAYFHSKALAVQAWNKRVDTPGVPAMPAEVREAIDRLVFDAMLHRQGVAAGMGYRPEEVTYPPHITIVQAWLDQQVERGE